MAEEGVAFAEFVLNLDASRFEAAIDALTKACEAIATARDALANAAFNAVSGARVVDPEKPAAERATCDRPPTGGAMNELVELTDEEKAIDRMFSRACATLRAAERFLQEPPAGFTFRGAYSSGQFEATYLVEAALLLFGETSSAMIRHFDERKKAPPLNRCRASGEQPPP